LLETLDLFFLEVDVGKKVGFARTSWISVALTREERDEVNAMAKRNGLNRSELLRSALLLYRRAESMRNG